MGARWRKVETKESREVIEDVEGISKVGFSFFGMTSVQSHVHPRRVRSACSRMEIPQDSETHHRRKFRQPSTVIHPLDLAQ